MPGVAVGLGVVGGVIVGVILQLVKGPNCFPYTMSSPEVIYDEKAVFSTLSPLFLWIRVNNMTIVVGILRAGSDTAYSLL